MYCICSSELTRSYSSATCQILHTKPYSHAEHTKSNLHVVLNSDSSEAREVTDHSNKIKQHVGLE